MEFGREVVCDYLERNKIPKLENLKLDLSGAIDGMMDFNTKLDEIAKDIRDKKDNVVAMEFTKCIGELLKKNGVVPKMTEYTRNFEEDNTFETRYGVSIDELDFSEHDKRFRDEIVQLKKQIVEYLHDINELFDENKELKQRIAELEGEKSENFEEEPIPDDARPSAEWYENRYQQDCITINRLNTTIDVLIHKIEYLRQFAGLE
jgi:uncharacterized coiled-coil DUF342 family protein